MTSIGLGVAGCVAGAVWLAGRAASRAPVERMLDGASPSKPGATTGSGKGYVGRGWATNGPIARAVWAALGAVLGAIVAGPLGTVVGGLAGASLRMGLDRRRQVRQRESFSDQLGDAATTLAAASRAGMSVEQALAYAGHELDAPLGPALQDVVERVALGQSLSASLDGWAADAATGEARLVAGVLQLHRRTGGDLAVVLDQVAGTIRERRAAEREVRSLTAQGRLSGIILGLLPLGFFAFLSVTAPHDMAIAYRSPAGVTAIVAGLVLELLAFVWIRRLLRVEV